MAGSQWADLPSALSGSLEKLSELLQSDEQLKAITSTDAIEKPVTFGYKSSGADNALLATVTNGAVKATAGSPNDALFTLSALPEQWEQFFKDIPVAPYQSYWGMFGMIIKQEGIEVQGDQTAMAQWTHVWRRVLELVHDAHCGPMAEDEQQPEPTQDHLTGRYVYLDAPVWGRVKTFYESSGEGRQQIVFLHTAGSDGRQYHGVMNDARMRKRCTMYCFDLPGHGRSFPSQKTFGAHTNTEDSYVGIITAFVKALGLRRPIICGASMAGQVCLAVAIRHKEVGAGGTIPLQGYVFRFQRMRWLLDAKAQQLGISEHGASVV
jgi:hypothetical protein